MPAMFELVSEFALCNAWKSPIVRGIDDCIAKLLARCGGWRDMAPNKEFAPPFIGCDACMEAVFNP
jgi:hypothetical protein